MKGKIIYPNTPEEIPENYISKRYVYDVVFKKKGFVREGCDIEGLWIRGKWKRVSENYKLEKKIYLSDIKNMIKKEIDAGRNFYMVSKPHLEYPDNTRKYMSCIFYVGEIMKGEK